MDVVDSHTHVISPDAERYPHAPLGGHRSDWSKARPVDHHGLVAAMDEAGIAQAVVVQASTVYGHDSRYVVEAVRAHPGRFVGVFSLDAVAGDAVDQIKRWRDEGLVGLRLFTTGSTMPGQADWLGDPRSWPAWTYAEAHGIPVCLQMTMDGIPMLRGLLQRFPQAKVLLDHLARPDLADGPPYEKARALFDLAVFPGVHLKLTNRTLAAAGQGASTATAFIPLVVQRFGADRVLWGSNFPAAEGSLAALLGEAKAGLSVLPEAERAAILAGSARRLYPALGDARHG
ncbi:amidohydrolase family protein [Inquilinus limosus]|uniref:Amidohydrolase n=1 Tax=Inquilinus limosus MP06 TaxID=1398085 RepID=A0A0A0D6Q4_9PROT|nr:amidohydrolase family protein [Inquilinus limosus]KGM33774.1 amidohydrolase [Inquilinus limosus MP06]